MSQAARPPRRQNPKKERRRPIDYRGAIAKTLWGKSWGDNLEPYSNYANRLPRGRTYVRNGSVIDLRITAGEVRAQVMGSSLYTVAESVTTVPEKQWQAICTDCSGPIDSLVELLHGKLANAVMERICKPGTGLSGAKGNFVQMQLTGRSIDVQARRCRAL